MYAKKIKLLYERCFNRLKDNLTVSVKELFKILELTTATNEKYVSYINELKQKIKQLPSIQKHKPTQTAVSSPTIEGYSKYVQLDRLTCSFCCRSKKTSFPRQIN